MITIPAIVIPIIASILLFLSVIYYVNEGMKDDWFTMFALILAVISLLGIPFVWTLYFTVLYFLQ